MFISEPDVIILFSFLRRSCTDNQSDKLLCQFSSVFFNNNKSRQNNNIILF